MEKRLKDRLAWINDQIERLDANLAVAPEGRLQTSVEHGYPRYYRILPGSSERHYLGPECKEEIRGLAQKDYDLKALPLLRQERKALERFLKCSSQDKLKQLYQGLPNAKKQFVKPVSLPDDEYAAAWEAQAFRQKSIDEALAFSTERGDLVRSKSEVIIANALYAAGIPYRYECLITLKGMGDVHPDFTVLNKRTREEFLWEHLGMMDDPQYFSKTMRKLMAYEANGYIEGKNLILTMEGSSAAFCTQTIRTKIETFLL